MTFGSIKVKAPGSAMIMGEHAVLHKQPALVTAIDRWITLTISPRQDQQLNVQSSYGSYQNNINQQPSEQWLQWIYTIIQSFRIELPIVKDGLSIHIATTFEGAIGLSSSTALTSALLFALAQWLLPNENIAQQQAWVFDKAMALLKKHNKVSSGAALQAVIYGGLRFYDSKTKISIPVEMSLPFYLVYCGYKTPTEDVVQTVQKKFSQYPNKLAYLYKKMGKTTNIAEEALQNNDVDLFYQSVDDYFILQKQLGVCDDMLDQLIDLANQSPLTRAAKISGAGLGDCILVVGDIDYPLWKRMQDCKIIKINSVMDGVQLC